LRNEDLYGPYAECLSKCEFIDEGKRRAYEFDARMCALNRIGTKAADFRFEDRNGRVRRLHEIKAEFTVLFFSNPGCEACMEIINALKNTPQITSLTASGKVAVLNIYIDEDLEAWRSYMPIYPEEWFNGFDPDFVIRTDVLYNVRAIPSLYLLDKDKNVIMKDAVTERVLDFFSRFVEQ
jgi:cytochrome oxidase Cu insertion factor (SCO1/SenC/PrrC family)